MIEKNNVWVFVELVAGKPSQLSLELLGKGRELANAKNKKLVGLLLGDKLQEAAKEVEGYGADIAVCCQDSALAAFEGRLYTKVTGDVLKKYEPNVLLIGGSANGRELGGRLSAQMNLGLVADCVDCMYESDNDDITWVRPAYTGKLFVKIFTTTRPQLATISDKIFRGNVFDASRQGETVVETVDLGDLTGTQKILSLTADSSVEQPVSEVTLENADIIVSAGRGVGSKEGMEKVQALAKSIGAAFGVSKPLVDEGWAPHEWQVGVTGKKVAPKVYIALGISGAIQHQLGIKEAKVVVAVNTDKEAPIFQRANYGIVGDLFKAIPEIEKQFKPKV